MATLRVNKLEKVGKQSFADGTFTIGRSLKNDMCLPHPSVSRHHCAIEIDEAHVVTLRDLDSRHGTTLNGKAVTHATLHDGDVIGVGTFEIRYSDELAPREDGDDHEIDLEISADEDSTGEHILAGSATGSVIALTPTGESDQRDTARHEAALNELREQIGELTEALEASESRARAATEAAAEPDDTSSALDAARAELSDTRAELESARAELARRDETIASLETDLAAAQTELQSAAAAREEATSQLRQDLEAARASADERQARADDLEARLAKQTAEALEQLTSFEQQRADYDDRLKQRETETTTLRRQAEKAQYDLDARSERLEEALRTIDMLKGDVKALKTQLAEARQRSRDVDQYLDNLRTSARHVLGVLQQLSTVRANVQTLENAYVQASEWADAAEADEGDNAQDLAAQRDAVGEQLQTAHGQLDETITELYQVTAQLTQYIVSDPVRATIEAGATPARRGFLSRLVRQ